MSDIIEKFSIRLNKALNIRNMKPVELHEKTGISESLISKYLSDNAIARQDKISLIANALNVNPVWLMGYDIPMEKEDIKQKIKKHIENHLSNVSLSIEELKQYITFYKSALVQDKNKKLSIPQDFDKEYYSYVTSGIDEEIVYYCNLNWVEEKISNDESFFINDIFNDNNSKITRSMMIEILDNLNYKKIENNLLLNNKKYYPCPIYGQISAGQPNWAEECLEGYLPLDPELMGIVNPEEHYFLKINGESMNKVIQNGAFALIHKQDTIENGEIAVVLVNGDNATLKRFSKRGDIVVLTPESTDESFEQQIYTKDTRIQIIGKYVGKMEFNK